MNHCRLNMYHVSLTSVISVNSVSIEQSSIGFQRNKLDKFQFKMECY